ncbi:MAG: UvrD-helicase domain-containing protein, partial [Myxococcales bacterium]|nr:UvrD-helicase domain-containing protein [Myxococcales bacterium]
MTAHVPRPAILPDPAQRLLVVQASAGTGKTFFLEHRVVDLLLRTDATIDRLLVVTFTEKATAELRARIRDKLTALAHAPDDAGPPADTPCWTIDAAARRKLRDALAGFDRAPIHTIHGFCQRLLVEDAFAGRRLFDQQQVPDDVAFTEAYHQALREELARQPAERRLLEAYLDAGGGSIATLGDVLLACVRRGAPVTPRLEVDDLLAQTARFAAALHAVIARGTVTAIAGVLGTTNGNTKRALTAKLTRLGTALAEAVASEADPEPRAVAVLAALARLRADHAGLDEAPDKLKDPTPAGVELIDAAAALVRGFVPLEAACAARFLDPVLRRVRAGKSRRGQFDFQDMLRLVRDTLLGERGAELAERLRRRHPWAMIDEFQDTDEVQWDIFRRVWADGDRTSLTIVGDPKQAIYAFRGADVQTYLTARADLEGRGADTVPLVDNYRSSGDVVEAVNALLRSHGEFFTGTIQYDHPVRAAGGVTATWPDGTAPSPVHVFEIAPAVDGEKLAAPDLLETLAERAAEEIRRLLDDPAYRLRVTDRHGQQQTLAPQDIHVLTRTGKESDRVAVALRARGVPCALYQREHLFEAPEAAEVADLLDAVADPRDRTARLLAWNTSFFGVPLADLRDLAEVPDGHPLIALLHDWRGLALRKDYDQLFARVLDDTRWIERAVVAGGGERAITNVLHLFELLHDDVARAPCEIHELAARLRGWIRTGTTTRPDDIDLQRLETDRHAVQIMTIHRAKGLEAAVVFVVGGYGGTFPDKVHLYHQPDGRRFLHVGPAVGDVDALIDADLREENQRLMYVALTRARVRLYLASAPGDYKHSPILPLHRCVGLALAARATDADARRLFTSEVVRVGSVLPPPPVEVADDLRGWRP